MALGLSPKQILTLNKYPLLAISKEWERVDLNIIADVQNGFAFDSALFSKDEGMPLIRIRDIQKLETENLYNGEFSPDYIIRKGDILVGMDGDFKASIWKGVDGLLNQRVCRLILKTQYYNKHFFFVCLQPYLDAINCETSSVTVKHLSSNTVKDIPLPLPPLPEQRMIVDKIESLFAELDNAVDNIDTALRKLKIYRQAVLQQAFTGELTKQWREEHPDLPTAAELLETIKTEREEHYQNQLHDWKQAVKAWEENGKTGKKPTRPKKPTELEPLKEEELENLPNLPNNWIWQRLEHLGELARGKSKHRPRNDKRLFGGKYPFIQTGEVKAAGHTIKAFSQTYSDLGLAQSKLWPKGTLCITIAANIAETAFLGFEACFPDSIVGFSGNNATIQEFFVFYFFKCNQTRIEAFAPATAQKNINLNTLQNLILPICSLAEQEQIVAEVERRLSVCDRVEEELLAARKKSGALRQSILKRAFEGKLLNARELEEARRAPDWEPADQLLRRLEESRGKKVDKTDKLDKTDKMKNAPAAKKKGED